MLRASFNTADEVAQAIMAIPADEVAIATDFDGTLADFMDDASAVRIPQETHDNIIALSKALHGAFAIVTGRDAEFIEQTIFSNNLLPGSYGHGAKLRRSAAHDLETTAIDINETHLDELIAQVALPEGVEIEIKSQARGIHWKDAPDDQKDAIGAKVQEIVEHLVAEYNKNHPEGQSEFSQVKAEGGRMVFEIGSVTATKGYAIKALREVEAFAGRKFVYFGDQPADESAMVEARQDGGLAIGAGPHDPKIAQYRLEGPADVRAVLKKLAENTQWVAHLGL